jgi:hypothetical protein
MKKAIAFIFVALFTLSGVFAQSRHSIYWGVGGNMFYGDLGAAKGEHGINFKTFGASAMLGYRYALTDRFTLRANLGYSLLHASDSDSKREAQQSRNLNFRSHSWELSGIVEFYLLKDKYFRHIEDWRRASFVGRSALYVFGGVGGLWFNPQGSYNGSWYFLQPLRTEGVEYKRIAASFPFGAGYKYQFSPRISLGLEIGFHPTTSDYLDDCHDTYVGYAGSDNGKNIATLSSDRSPMCYLLSDKSGKYHAAGVQRGGNDDRDWFGTVMVTLSYKFKSKSFNANGLAKYQK